MARRFIGGEHLQPFKEYLVKRGHAIRAGKGEWQDCQVYVNGAWREVYRTKCPDVFSAHPAIEALFDRYVANCAMREEFPK